MTDRAELWALLVRARTSRDGRVADPTRLCVACAEILGVAGTAITLMGSGGVPAAGYASDPVTERLQGLQFTIGHGPVAEAHATGVPVSEVDLGGGGSARWLGFCREAVEGGICAVFSFPLRVGAARVGVLTVYQAEPGPLAGDTYADALVVAELFTRMILGWQADASDGSLAVELGDVGAYHAAVHQASGRISVQLDIDIGEAVALLRARSFATSRPIDELAADVNNGTIRFDN